MIDLLPPVPIAGKIDHMAKFIEADGSEISCEKALSDLLVLAADEAHAAGWSREEIVTVMMETANAWYLGEIGPRTGEPQELARRLIKHGD